MSSQGRILLVESNEELREAVRELLEALGHPVLAADGALEALDTYRRNAAEISLLLVGADARAGGLELVEEIRRHGEGPGVILVSSRTEAPGRHERRAAGGVCFLHKPFSIAALASKIAEATPRRTP